MRDWIVSERTSKALETKSWRATPRERGDDRWGMPGGVVLGIGAMCSWKTAT
jgi:hypothetical protein